MKFCCRILFIMLCFMYNSPFAQIAFQDAKGIVTNGVNIHDTTFSFKADPVSVQALAAYLRNYLPEAEKNRANMTEDQVLDRYKENPFFGIQIQSLGQGGASPKIAGILSNAASSIGGLNVTTVADGIARFLVERTKAELDIYFFEQFRDFLLNDDYGKDLKMLFPNTHSMMLLAGKEIYDYQKYLQAFREAFAQDLASLLANSHAWVNQEPPLTTLVAKIQASKFYPYLDLALQVAVDIQVGKHPGDIMNGLAARTYADSTWGEFGPMLKASNIVSQSLRSANADRYWINEDEFTTFKDPVFTKIYLGLIYQQFKSSTLEIDGTLVTSTLEKFAGHLDDAADAINNFRPVLTKIDQILKQLKSSDEEGNAGNYLVLANSFTKIISVATSGLIQTDKPMFRSDRAVEIEFLLGHAFNLVADVRTKSYSAAVIEFSLLLKQLNVEEKFVTGLIRYGSFMANVATARTSEEVKAAIEVVALPPGSYRVKRESEVNVSLNGYLGFYGGNEYMAASEKGNSFSAGLFAPVGLALSRGKIRSDDTRAGKSFTLFASVIDLGALASFRFNDDQTDVASDIHFEDIFAPGAFLIWGFGKAPICLGAGVQMGPSLRDVDPTGNPNINKDYYVRTAAFIVVDIPFLNLYNRKDEKTKKARKK